MNNVIEVSGKFNKAKIFTDIVDNASISQVITLLNQSYVKDSKIRMMPDIHAGAGCTIGTTMTFTDKICPNLVGVDIGCGMEVIQLREKHIELQRLDKVIKEYVPAGFNIRTQPHKFSSEIDLNNLKCGKVINYDRAINSIGTLGGGNHFIEIDKDDEGNLYLVVHSGSRHLGVEIAKHYQDLGYKSMKKVDRRALIEELKSQGREQEIEEILTNLKKDTPNIPYSLSYVEGDAFTWYVHDMNIAQKFAALNRKAIVDTIIKKMKLHIVDTITTIHNYLDIENNVLRKGAVSAKAGEQLIIPINMRDGSLLCTGKGNEEWNYSAPHGAGRLMSRSQAKESFTVNEFKKQMKDVYSTSVNSSTLDECPMAYKNMEDIVNNIEDTVKIDKIIKPIYNFKAGDVNE